MADQFLGEIRIGAFNFAPTGWALCNGQLLPLSQNTALFALLGTSYGGDGRTTFALPNLVDRSPIGAGQGAGLSSYFLGESGGQATVSLTGSHMPPHTHQMTASATAALNNTPDATQRLAVATVSTFGPAQNLVPMQTTSVSGGAPHDNRQPYLGLTFIIALQGILPGAQLKAPVGAVTWELRPATAEDREFLFAVYASTREEELAPLGWPDDIREAFLRSQFEAQDRFYRDTYPAGRFDVILVDGTPAGRLTVARLAEEMRVVDISLLPARRGRGLGTAVLEAVLREADEAQLRATIHVEERNRARFLYERLGFEAVETRSPYVLMTRKPFRSGQATIS